MSSSTPLSNDAARASLRLLAADPGAPRRRVVIALDLPGATPDAADGRAAVRLVAPVGLEQVAAVHVDHADAEQTVRAAVEALDAAGTGDADAAARGRGAGGFRAALVRDPGDPRPRRLITFTTLVDRSPGVRTW